MTKRDEGYVELHANSAFSFLEGASHPEALIETAVEQGMPAMALLDRNGVYGAARFHLKAQEKGVEAHIGAEVAVLGFGASCASSVRTVHRQKQYPPRLPLLCASQEGYANLCQLITRYKMRQPGKAEGFAFKDDLHEFSSGLICLTGGDEGLLAAALNRGGVQEGRAVLEELQRIYGSENVYVELQRHGLREEEWRNQAALELAESLKLPVIATNGVRYATQYEREVLDVFTAIRNGTDVQHAGRMLQTNSQRHLRCAAAMRNLFADVPEAIENTVLLSQRLGFRLQELGYVFPSYPVPEGESMESFLRKRVAEGMEDRYSNCRDESLKRRARRQVEKELALIEKLGFAGYFLIVWDVVRHCRKNDILIQGRGSAANSIVCYALKITAIDPIRMHLLFDRFLNENRHEWPDIDLDLPSGDKREEAIRYVYQCYGELGAAMTANVITYRGKSASREVGKALGFDEETLRRLSSLIGQWEWRRKGETITDNFRQAGFDLQHRRIAKYVELTERIQDLPRHLGQHSGGMVICQGALNTVVPLERASMANRTVVQWDKEDCAALEMVKVDLLGLGMMSVMEECLYLVPKHYGDNIDLGQLPRSKKVFEALQRADTVGMFQVESRAQMASLPRNKPKRFYDLVVQVAIIRPGPIVGKMMHPYMRRRQGLEAITYPLPSLKPVLRRTLGVPLFQEQLLRMAMRVGNFTGAEADELRKAVGMRRSWERMEKLMLKLREGMTSNGIAQETQNDIVQSIQSFALYGFPESHAASFALIAYASAYFKVKYLAAFLCAMLNNQPMGFYSAAVLVKDAQRHGLRVKAMDVQVSERACTVEHDEHDKRSVRMGLMYVRGMHARVADAIVAERERGGPYRNAEDLARRVPVLNRRDMAQLARVGALNWMEGVQHRRDAIWQVEQCSRPAGPLLHGVGNVDADATATSSPLRQMSNEDRLVADYSGTGLTTGHHPMAFRRKEMRRAGIRSASELRDMPDGAWARAAGAIIARQRPGTAKGFIFLSMEDETGIANVVIHPELYERDRLLITRGKFLQVEGPLQNQSGVVHVKAERVKLLELSSVDIRSHDFH
jgi:error-prone DNA polymerase